MFFAFNNGIAATAELQQESFGQLRDRMDEISGISTRNRQDADLMLEQSEEYGIRRELVLAFLRAFYRLWWAGAPEMSLSVLPGEHLEGAVVNVRLDTLPWGLSRIPLISPACAGRQIFVNHPDISAYIRHRTVELLARESGPLSVEPAQVGLLQDTLDELAVRQLGLTAGYLARGLPVFAVVFSTDGSFVA